MGIPVHKIECRRREMEKAFPVANVPAPPALVSVVQAMSKTVAQRKDAHVIATSVAATASFIDTHNIKDFAAPVLSHYKLAKMRPDPFCLSLLATHPARVLAGIRAHRASLKRAPMSPTEYVKHLADDRVGLPKLAIALAQQQAAI
jgi:hypothetical protein